MRHAWVSSSIKWLRPEPGWLACKYSDCDSDWARLEANAGQGPADHVRDTSRSVSPGRTIEPTPGPTVVQDEEGRRRGVNEGAAQASRRRTGSVPARPGRGGSHEPGGLDELT